ncbi:MAG: exodeoxyribonuclease VII large subunit [Planctomycetota bacterium]
MTGSVELDQDGKSLLIRFPYREDLVAMVKDLPGRRWDPRQKVWRVPAKNVEAVYSACARHLFEFGPEISSLLAGTLEIPADAPTPKPGSDAAPADAAAGGLAAPGASGSSPSGLRLSGAAGGPPALTIHQLNERVKRCLGEAFPESFWIVGEVVDFDKSADREHRFFQLIEKAPRAQRPKAVVSVALFGRTAQALLPKLAAGEPPLTLRDGLEIRVLVRVDFYPASGRFQVIVNDIDPSFTLGKLALTKEQILRELAEKGLAEQNRRLGLPVPTLRIAVLTSPDADGWTDFRRHLEEAGCGFEVTLFPVKVQGPDLKRTMLSGLSWFAERAHQFDVLCVLRGGGSRTDLAWFDDREVAVAVAKHPLKILVGIGHQRDQSVLDAIAQSEKTPTAVAEFLVRGVEAVRIDIQEQGERLASAVQDLLADERDRLRTLAQSIATQSRHRVGRAGHRLIAAASELASATHLRLSRERAELRHRGQSLAHHSSRLLERAGNALKAADTRRRLLDPTRVLQRGFAIVRGADGRIAPSITRIDAGHELRVQLRDGHADVQVQATHGSTSHSNAGETGNESPKTNE